VIFAVKTVAILGNLLLNFIIQREFVMHLAPSLTLYSDILQSVILKNPWTVSTYMLIVPREEE